MTYDRDLLSPLPAAHPGEAVVVAPVVVAPVRPRDLLKVARLQRRCFRPPLAYGLTTLLLLWLLPNVRFLVAREGDRIIGCAIGDRNDDQARVITICVDPDVRRRGIGARLLRGLEEALPEGSVMLMVEESNEGAQALYRQEGYLPVGVSRDYYGRGNHGIWMQKQRAAPVNVKIRV